MGVPSGEIIARPLVARACGCMQEFQHYAVDKYRAQRLAKFQSTRCPACIAKMVEEQKKAAIPKGEAFKRLPAGARLTQTRLPDGNWSGTLTAEGRTVEAVGEGPQGLAVALARLWLGAADEKAPVAKSTVPNRPKA